MRRHQNGCVRLERHKETGKPLFWLGVWREDVFQDGRVVRRQKSRKLADYCDRYRNESDVKPLLDEIVRPLNEGRHDARGTMSICEFVDTYYLPYVRENCKPSTSSEYRKLWRVLKASLDGKVMRDFRTVDAANMLIHLQRRGLGRRSLQHAKSLMSGIFTYAKNLGVLDGVNPVQGALIPKKAKPPQETHAATRQEVQKMLDIFKDNHQIRAAIGLMFFAGLRPGEARGVRWEDYTTHFDETRKSAEWRLAIHQSVWRTHVTAPKTEGSSKPVPVINSLRLLLEELREAEGNPQTGPILRGQSGKPLNLDNLARRVIIPTVEKCVKCRKSKIDHKKDGHAFELDETLRWHGWYALRRGIATEVTAATKDVLAAKGLLRHASISTTMAHYIKDVPDATLRGLERIEELCSNREVGSTVAVRIN